MNLSKIMAVILAAALLGSCSGGSNNDSVDTAALPDTPPKFEISPIRYPNGLSQDLHSFGSFNKISNCDIIHYGWDFTPDWSSYPDDNVPVLAVADGTITSITLRATNVYNNHNVNTFAVFLAVAKEVTVEYTFEPFIQFNGTEAMKWISVTRGQNVKAGDVIGYLPKVSQNLGETLIHLDWKIAVGSGEGTFVCPTPYFSSSWVSANEATLVSKLSACSALCSE